METGRFYSNSSSKIVEKFRSLQVKFAVEQENYLGEYSLFFKEWEWGGYEYRKTEQNNIRKPKTALNLPENYRKTLGFVKLQYPNLK